MSEKLYGAFVVSKKPINLGGLPDDPDVVHIFNEEFDLRPHSSRPTLVISKPLSYGANNEVNHQIQATGSHTLVAIADWFKAACSFVAYLASEQRRLKLQEERNRSTGDK